MLDVNECTEERPTKNDNKVCHCIAEAWQSLQTLLSRRESPALMQWFVQTLQNTPLHCWHSTCNTSQTLPLLRCCLFYWHIFQELCQVSY